MFFFYIHSKPNDFILPHEMKVFGHQNDKVPLYVFLGILNWRNKLTKQSCMRHERDVLGLFKYSSNVWSSL